MDWPADKIKRRKVDSLIPYARNARTHSDEQVAQIAASIKEWGWTTPVLIDEDGGIIAGHGRVMAARKLGIEEVPTMTATGWSQAQKQAYVLADNQLPQNAEWDMDLLAVEMKDLDGDGFDLSLIGFGDDMLANMLVEETVGLTDEDAVPDVPENPVTVEGDVWILGDHRLMCGDSTSIDAVEKLMGGVKADIVVTSPPYNQGNSEGDLFHHGKKNVKLYDGECTDDMTSDDYRAFLLSVMNCLSVVVNDSHSVVWNVSYNAKSRDDYGKIVFSDANPFTVKETIIWNKNGSINLPQKGIYSRKCELVFVMSSCEEYRTSQNKGDCRWNYFDIGKEKQYDKDGLQHRATYPVDFALRCVDEFSLRGDTLLDPFGGSGTTMIAAEKNGRHSRLMELDPKYCDVIVQRWQDFTGQQAKLEESGDLFPTIKAHAA
jgi:DNA modification methylase